MNILEWIRTYGHPGLNTALVVVLAFFMSNRINTEITARETSDRELRSKLSAIETKEDVAIAQVRSDLQQAIEAMQRDLIKLETLLDKIEAAPELTTEQLRFREGIDKRMDRIDDRISRLESQMLFRPAPSTGP